MEGKTLLLPLPYWTMCGYNQSKTPGKRVAGTARTLFLPFPSNFYFHLYIYFRNVRRPPAALFYYLPVSQSHYVLLPPLTKRQENANKWKSSHSVSTSMKKKGAGPMTQNHRYIILNLSEFSHSSNDSHQLWLTTTPESEKPTGCRLQGISLDASIA